MLENKEVGGYRSIYGGLKHSEKIMGEKKIQCVGMRNGY